MQILIIILLPYQKDQGNFQFLEDYKRFKAWTLLPNFKSFSSTTREDIDKNITHKCLWSNLLPHTAPQYSFSNAAEWGFTGSSSYPKISLEWEESHLKQERGPHSDIPVSKFLPRLRSMPSGALSGDCGSRMGYADTCSPHILRAVLSPWSSRRDRATELITTTQAWSWYIPEMLHF